MDMFERFKLFCDQLLDARILIMYIYVYFFPVLMSGTPLILRPLKNVRICKPGVEISRSKDLTSRDFYNLMKK